MSAGRRDVPIGEVTVSRLKVRQMGSRYQGCPGPTRCGAGVQPGGIATGGEICAQSKQTVISMFREARMGNR